MIRKNELLGLAISTAFLAGCYSLNKMVESQKPTLREVGNYVIEENGCNIFANHALRVNGTYSEETLESFAKRADRNKDFYVSTKEAKERIARVDKMIIDTANYNITRTSHP